MTQDAVLADKVSIRKLVSVFDDTNDSIGVAYGRQLPRPQATPIEAHARIFNYPQESEVRGKDSIASRGIKAAFTSDSFAAYQTRHLIAVGGFPATIGSEDMLVAAKMLKANLLVAYVSEATVYHSHAYSLKQEFSRYFDIGVMHSSNPWLLAEFGKPEGEGLRFVKSEMQYLADHRYMCIPSAMARTFFKYAGYKLGLRHRTLSADMCRRFSMFGQV